MVGHWQIIIILLVILLLFGASRLGDIGKGLGEGIRNFKKGVSEDSDKSEDDEESKQLTDAEKPAPEDASQKDEQKKA